MVEKILHKHRRWISKRLNRSVLVDQSLELNPPSKKTFLSQDPIFLDGTPFYLVWEKNDRTEVTLEPQNRLLQLNSKEEKKIQFQEILTEWATNRFLDRVRKILHSYKNVLDFEPQRVFIRPTRSQWGSMSGNRNMSLSWNLLPFEEKAVHYIILHELVHIRFSNHSQKFWDVIRQHMPDYLQAKKDLLKLYPLPKWLDPFKGKKQSLELRYWGEKLQ